MKRFLAISLLLTLFVAGELQAQCSIEITSPQDTVCMGVPFTFAVSGNCDDYVFNCDFNSWFCSGLSTNCIPGIVGNPCKPSPDNSLDLWVYGCSFPRELITVQFPIEPGFIACFDMIYGTAGDTGQCAGISDPDQGVHLQVSWNAGNTWTELAYWSPDPDSSGDIGHDPLMTSWQHYCVDLPDSSAPAQFRWRQDSVEFHDSALWGLDNVKIFRPHENQYSWYDLSGFFSADSTPTCIINGQTAGNYVYIVSVTDGIDVGTDTVTLYASYCTNISESGNQPPFSVFPNPAHESVIISGEGIKQASLSDLTGKTILLKPTEMDINGYHRFSLSEIPAGIYLLEIITTGKTERQKLIIY